PDGFKCDLGRHGRRTRARDPGRREDMDQRVRPLPRTGEGRGGAGVPDRRLAVRRGRGVRRDRPPSVVLNTTLAPRYTVFASRDDTGMGDVQLKRYFRFAGFISVTPDR